MAATHLSVHRLRKLRACPGQVEIFKRTFGAKAALTVPNLRKALKAGLQLEWAVQNLIPWSQRDLFNNEVIQLPERQAYFTVSAVKNRADGKVWDRWHRALDKWDYGTRQLRSARSRRDAALACNHLEHYPGVSAAKAEYDLAMGKVLLKYLRKGR